MMTRKHYVIYIPGLGDQAPHYQPQIIKRWKKFGLMPHYNSVGWADGERFEHKLTRLTKLVDELYERGHVVSLIGVSAGASAALNAYCERPTKISRVVFICGKIIGFNNVNPSYFKNNPAFEDSLQLTQQNLNKLTLQDKAKMISMRPIFDNVVPVSAMLIPGVKSRLIISILHVPSIFLAITIYRSVFIAFLKAKAVNKGQSQ